MPRRPLLLLAGLTALAAVVRFATLDVQSFWLDEAVSALLIRESFGDMLDSIPDSESTPPLYYVLAWLWAKLFGGWEIGLRSLSALLGTATVPVVYLLGARLFSERAGLTAAALVAVNPLLVWYSQEARAYALLVFLSALSLLLLVRALDGWRRADLAGWAIVSALALATHYFAVFIVAPEALWLLLAARRAGRLRGAVLAVAAPVAAGIALLPLALDQRSNEFADYIDDISLPVRILQLPKQLLIGYDSPVEALFTVLALLIAAGAVWLLVSRSGDSERRALRPLAGLAAACAGVPLLLSLVGVDYFLTRNVIAVAVPVVLLLAAGFAAREGLAPLVALCALSIAIVIAVAIEPRYQRDDWRGVAEALGEPVSPERAILTIPQNSEPPLTLYMDRVSPAPVVFTPGEIAVASIAQHEPGRDREPAKLPEDQTYPGYTEFFRESNESFTVFRLRAPMQIAQSGAGITRLRAPDESFGLLWQVTPP